MPECGEHCPHYMNPANKNIPWENTPCSTCAPELSNKGRTHISIDVNPNLATCAAIEDAPSGADRYQDMAGLLRVMLDLLSCNPLTLRLIIEKTLNPELSWAQLARREGITRTAVHQRVTVALRRFPELQAIVSISTSGISHSRHSGYAVSTGSHTNDATR